MVVGIDLADVARERLVAGQGVGDHVGACGRDRFDDRGNDENGAVAFFGAVAVLVLRQPPVRPWEDSAF